MSARARLVAGVVVLLAALAVAIVVLAVGEAAGKWPGGLGEPAEDDPGWSCVLHGNRRCGGAS
ncbi:hypothetical protein [Jiangella muralis]|uniref:hypothetical protein n=1 Tax=Jiangella muralis TaxID=702383 RepID=UPI00069E32E1|nr:hypothetical protein [Jiangella muralis]